MDMTEMFWMFFISSLVGFILALGKMCYKSKCSTIELCCFKIIRNIEAEVKEDIELGNNEESKK
jgi:hypothetical protein